MRFSPSRAGKANSIAGPDLSYAGEEGKRLRSERPNMSPEGPTTNLTLNGRR